MPIALVLGILVVLVIMASRVKATSPGVQVFAEAIAAAEGYGVPGAIPTVRNNPGDLKLSGGVITTFATPSEGWAALYRQIELMRDGRSAYYSPTMTLADVSRVWTATEQSAWLSNVIHAMRVRGYDVSPLSVLRDIL
jgi:hypothetical protein